MMLNLGLWHMASLGLVSWAHLQISLTNSSKLSSSTAGRKYPPTSVGKTWTYHPTSILMEMEIPSNIHFNGKSHQHQRLGFLNHGMLDFPFKPSSYIQLLGTPARWLPSPLRASTPWCGPYPWTGGPLGAKAWTIKIEGSVTRESAPWLAGKLPTIFFYIIYIYIVRIIIRRRRRIIIIIINNNNNNNKHTVITIVIIVVMFPAPPIFLGYFQCNRHMEDPRNVGPPEEFGASRQPHKAPWVPSQ